MKIICKTQNENELLIKEMHFGGALTGHRIKEVTLGPKDLTHIAEVIVSGSETQQQHLLNYLARLYTKVLPEDLYNENSRSE